MNEVVITIGLIVVFITIWPALNISHWLGRALDFPYVHLTYLSLACAIPVVYFWSELSLLAHILGILLLVSLLFRMSVIWPYIMLAPAQVKKVFKKIDDPSISLLTANVYQYNKEYSRLTDLVDQMQPDVILLLETDQKWFEEMFQKLQTAYPHHLAQPMDNTYGLVLFSKLELRNPQIRFLLDEEVPSISTDVVIDSQSVIRFYGVHPKPPAPGHDESSIGRDAELVMVGREARESEFPVIVAGDLNDVAWSHTTRRFIRLSGLLDPRRGRGFFNTFPVNYPLFRWSLDHVFVSYHFKLMTINRLQSIGSDHFPIFIDLVLDPGITSLNEVEHPTNFDQSEARETVKKAKDPD